MKTITAITLLVAVFAAVGNVCLTILKIFKKY